jgi:HlyD family secretion protein
VVTRRTDTVSDIAQVLGLDRPSAGRKRLRLWMFVVVALALIAAVVAFLAPNQGPAYQFKTAEAQRGNLTVTVTATGTLKPVTQVEVGSELSGTIKTVEVDYNDRVKVGQVLARLDTDKLEAQMLQSQAALTSAQTKLLEAQATLLEMHNELKRLRHVRELSGGKMPSQHEMDTAEAALNRAQASEASTKAQIAEAGAKLRVDQTNLAKAVIRAPITGIVLKRQVEPGQTVAASLQAPVLFTLAENLAHMELHVAVDEADVGQVTQGQRAKFTVDAYPEQAFPAVITKVYYAAQTVEGVVTYETVLSVENADMMLRPGMTATADITVKQRPNVLLLPNAALRFTPPALEESAASGGGGLLGRLLPRPPSSMVRRKDVQATSGQKRVWTLREGVPVAIPVTVGATDGQMTEVVAGDISPGLPLLVDMVRRGK